MGQPHLPSTYLPPEWPPSPPALIPDTHTSSEVLSTSPPPHIYPPPTPSHAHLLRVLERLLGRGHLHGHLLQQRLRLVVQVVGRLCDPAPILPPVGLRLEEDEEV